MGDNQRTVERLLEKSKETFTLAVELYNRPTLKYHAESCSILLCNAWELMLKAYLIEREGIDSIYFPDSENKTITLSDCLKRIFTNDKDPVRINMDVVIQFRNENTHYITGEHEIFMGPYLQKAVENFDDKLLDLHGESVAELIPENALTLSVRRGAIEPDVIRATYEPRVAERLLSMSRVAASAADPENGAVAAIYETNFRLVKKQGDADLNVYVDKDAESGVALIKDIKDATSYYPFTWKGLIREVDRRLQKNKVEIQFKGQERNFNSHDLNLFVKAYSMKGDARYSYDRSTEGERNPSWIYSKAAVEHIVRQLTKDPVNCIDNLKRAEVEKK